MKKKIILIFIAFLTTMICFSCGVKESGSALEEQQDNNIVSSETKIDKESSNKKATKNIEVEIDNTKYDAFLYDNEASNNLIKDMPLTLTMEELNGNEKFAYLDYTLPVNEKNVENIEVGDIMLYQNNCIVIFYKDFKTSYSYTRLGKITDKSFAENIGSASINVRFK